MPEPSTPSVHAFRYEDGITVTLEIHGRALPLMQGLGGDLCSVRPLVDHLQAHYASPVDEPAYFVARQALRGLGWEPVGCMCLADPCDTCGGLGHTWQRIPAAVPQPVVAEVAIADEMPDLAALPWVFEIGEDGPFPDDPEPHPYRTVFAIEHGAMDDRVPVADLDPDVFDELGHLLAASPAMARLLVKFWRRIDDRRCEDARRTRWIHDLQEEAGAIIGDLRRKGVVLP